MMLAFRLRYLYSIIYKFHCIYHANVSWKLLFVVMYVTYVLV